MEYPPASEGGREKSAGDTFTRTPARPLEGDAHQKAWLLSILNDTGASTKRFFRYPPPISTLDGWGRLGRIGHDRLAQLAQYEVE